MPNALRTLEHELAGGSLVLLDQGSADAIACNAGGLHLLLSLGALNVGDLSHDVEEATMATIALTGNGRLSNVMIIVSTLLGEAEGIILEACKRTISFVDRITVACALSEAAHGEEDEEAYSSHCYEDFAAMMHSKCSEYEKYSVSLSMKVIHVPLPVIPIGPSVFVLPAGSAAATARWRGKPLGLDVRDIHDADQHSFGRLDGNISLDRSTDGSADARHSLSQDHIFGSRHTQGIAALAHALSHVAAALGVDAEVFCLGPASSDVAKAWSFVPPASLPGKADSFKNHHPAAFVLMDRTGDMLTPCLHPDLLLSRMWEIPNVADEDRKKDIRNWSSRSEHELDSMDGPYHPTQLFLPARNGRCMSTLPRSARTKQNTFDNCSPEEDEGVQRQDEFRLSASLLHPSDLTSTSHLAFLLTRNGRDAIMFIRKWLREAVRREGVQAQGRSKLGSISAQELEMLVASLSQNPLSAHRTSSLRQVAAIASSALSNPFAEHWEYLAGAEKALMSACEEGNTVVLEQLQNIMDSSAHMGPTDLNEVALFLMIAYFCLAEHMPWYAGDGEDFVAFSHEQESILNAAFVESIVGRCRNCASSQESAAAYISIMEREMHWLPSSLRQQALSLGAAGSRHASDLDSPDAENLDQFLRNLRAGLQGALWNLFRRLGSLSKRHRQAMSSSGSKQSRLEAKSASLAARIAAAAVEDADISQLVPANTSLAGLLRTGLGSLGIQRQVRLGRYQTIVIFIVGGLSLTEAHEALTVADAKIAALKMAEDAAITSAASSVGEQGKSTREKARPHRVIVGGSTLLRPQDMIRMVI